MDALKVVSFLQRRDDIVLSDFTAHWRTIHKDHALKLAQAGYMKAYVQNHRVEEVIDGLPVMADGAPELWIDELDALERLVNSPEFLEGAGPDETDFMTPPAIGGVVHERVMLGGEGAATLPECLKIMLVVRRNPQISQAEFQKRWMNGRAPVLSPAGRPVRLTRQSVIENGQETTFHGVECSWWPDLASFRQAWAARNLAGVADWIDVESLRALPAREFVIVAPPA